MVKGKGQGKAHRRTGHEGPEEGVEVYLFFLNLGARLGVGGQRHAPAALTPGKTRYPLYSRMGWPQGRSVRVWKICPPPGFDPRTVQPVASRYTDWAPSGLEYCCKRNPRESECHKQRDKTPPYTGKMARPQEIQDTTNRVLFKDFSREQKAKLQYVDTIHYKVWLYSNMSVWEGQQYIKINFTKKKLKAH